MRLGVSSVLLLFGFCLVACNKPAVAVAQDAKQSAAALTGDRKGSAAANPQCKLFTTAEVQSYGGTAVSAGTNAALGSGCQWPAAAGDGNGAAMLQILPARDHEPPSGAPGFKRLAGVGKDGFVLPEMGGWHAGAIQGDRSINVTTSGPAASEQKTVEFLREAMRRVAGS